jgi:hypothetical protein
MEGDKDFASSAQKNLLQLLPRQDVCKKDRYLLMDRDRIVNA